MNNQLNQAEHKLLCMAVREAAERATRGEEAAGYRCLLAGLNHSVELEAAGEPWARELGDEYRLAMRFYEELLNSRRRRAPVQVCYRFRPRKGPMGLSPSGWRNWRN